MYPTLVRVGLAASALGLAIIVSCTGDAGPAGPAGDSGLEQFEAPLSGGSEVPPLAVPGTGTATFTVVGDALLFRLDVENMEEVRAAHIHGPAAVGVNAPVRVNLYSPPAGTTFTGTGTVAQGAAPAPRAGADFDSVLVLLRNGNAYVNVHTVANPGGKIRGQIVLNP